MLTRKKKFVFTIIIAIAIAAIAIVGVYCVRSKINTSNIEAIVAGSTSDMRVETPIWDPDNGRVITGIKLGKSTANSIAIAKTVSDIANFAAQVASLVDLGNNLKTIQKAFTNNYSTAGAFLSDYFDLGKIAALDPTTIAPKVLGWMTSALAKKVDSNCLQQTVNYALKNNKNSDGSVMIYLSRNFFSERYNSWFKSNSGYYLYYQNEWGVKSVPSLTNTISFYDLHTVCKETKTCIKYMYDNGKDGSCWF